MANIKSQIKRNKTNEKANDINVARKSELKTAIKKVENAVKANKKDEATSLLKDAVSLLDRYSQLGTISVNSANRKKAHLTKAVESL